MYGENSRQLVRAGSEFLLAIKFMCVKDIETLVRYKKQPDNAELLQFMLAKM